MGAREVVGIYRSAAHVPSLERLGVTPIDRRDIAEVEASAAHCDLVFDAVGGPLGTTILSALRAGAGFVAYGLLSGQPVTVAPRAAPPQRFHLRDTLETTGESQWHDWFRELWPRLKCATLSAVAPFPMTDWKAALAFFECAGRSSKPLLTMD
jgi:NADPH:quinone reductase-like Zn-dependent oxidoreductase